MSARAHRRELMALGGAAALATAGALAQRRHLRRIAQDPEQNALREPPRGEPISVRSSDGTQIQVELFGNPDGQPVVLVHGWTEMLAYWTYVIRDLSQKGFRVIAYDLRGHGESEPAAGGDYSLARFGEDLEAVLDTCVPPGRRAVVAGHSLGAMSIAAWAEHHDVARAVGAAAFLNTGVGELIAEHLLIPVPAVAQALNRVLPASIFLGSHARVPKFSTPLSSAITRYIAFGPEASPAQIAFFERMLVACPPDARADAGIAMSEMDLYHVLPRVTVPTLVLAGEQDRLTPPSHARRIAEALPDCRKLIILPRTGHMGPLERPREVSEALIELASYVPADTAATTA
jgi:pimeloyl-ACP methyl ester carboxylesterase